MILRVNAASVLETDVILVCTPAGLLLPEMLRLCRSSRSVKALFACGPGQEESFDCCTGVLKKKTRADNDAS